MKKVVLTGTSRGIGFELAKVFVEHGHEVLALSRNEQPINDLGLDRLHAIPCDLTQEEDLQKAEAWIKEHWNQVDILIHNAGALVNKPFEETGWADFERVYAVNVFAVAGLTRVLIPYMQSGSHVLTISSMGGVQGSAKFPGLAAYSSSKGAVITLSELLAEEYKEQGIAFNVVALGAVQTEMLEEAFPGYQAPVSPQQMAAYLYCLAVEGNQFYNGKILPVSASTP
ncbi:SDR family NAD(P)-dependent oxidoreductase [Croceiramulus getboli]|nr:SDR family oxidoreductase [Flavobacteriaceae bacterium YJPT1-3]